MPYKCPKCSSTDLSVTISTEAKLTQYEGNFETEVIGDHEWDDCSNMSCGNCFHCDAASAFEVELTDGQG